MKKMSGP